MCVCVCLDVSVGGGGHIDIKGRGKRGERLNDLVPHHLGNNIFEMTLRGTEIRELT